MRRAHASSTGEPRLCLDIGEDLSVYVDAVEWAAIADMADLALQQPPANKPAGKKVL
ncbi:hypothetical protein [Rhodococcus sp. 1R11]|uniref:hypothetical protein n=1 Tax=Rhodococcus sp. 1R11 TaxID=2559614 RepID=UPI00142F5323|nr:hypothetical protein [Rhodococcus sp. 1R11]